MAEYIGVRISLASPQADLAAVVWPGASAVVYPRAESVLQIRAAAEHIRTLERLRGIRPGTVELRPLIESATGVTLAREIASSSDRIQAFGVGPNLQLHLGVEPDTDSLMYARAECELHARGLGLDPRDIQRVLD